MVAKEIVVAAASELSILSKGWPATAVMVGDGGGNSGKPWWGRKVQTEGSKWPNDQEFRKP